MIVQSASSSFDSSGLPQLFCPCGNSDSNTVTVTNLRRTQNLNLVPYSKRRKQLSTAGFLSINFQRKCSFLPLAVSSAGGNPNSNVEVSKSIRRGAKIFVVKQITNELDSEELSEESSTQMGSNFVNFQEDPIVDKLRTQLGVIHPIPSPPINRTIVGLFAFFFFVGVVFDKMWTSRKRNKLSVAEGRRGAWPQVPTSFSLFLEKDLQRKESVEWVNMVLEKLWKVYRPGIENWIIGLLQPIIDDLKKPDYVQRVEIKQFSLGDQPLSVRNVERRTSRRVNDLQYQIGLRYTGGAQMLLMLSLNFGIIPVVVPVGVQDFDIDGELWVKLRLIPTEPWVGAASWAFVTLPKIKFELSAFRLFNLMAIPVLSMFLTKLLTEDLPRLFVRPKRIVLDFQKGKAVGPVPNDFKAGDVQQRNKDFVGELSVTLVDAQKISYFFYGKTDPYVILSLGDQIIRSKKNSQTTVIGPPGEPIWNQVDLGSLQDTVPTDRVVVLTRGWGLFRKGSSGEVLLRLTYKAYVEDEEDDKTGAEFIYTDGSDSDDEMSGSDGSSAPYIKGETVSPKETDKESFMDVLAALIMSEEFQGIVASENRSTKTSNDAQSTDRTISRPGIPDVETISQDSNSGSERFQGSPLFWLAIITSISVLIAVNVGGSGFFNP